MPKNAAGAAEHADADATQDPAGAAEHPVEVIAALPVFAFVKLQPEK